ncbi:C2H2 finger domain transcription factor mtfA [Paramyrothecium foliicola]|nr:C2H2 finger domain transcription factor mtfA [Paramyrothecium foliicola]
MATTLLSPQHYHMPQGGRYTSFTQPPQPPPSPPMEESRCSLPSISNLLGLADAGSPTSESSPTSLGPSSRLEDLVQRRPELSYAKPDAQRGPDHAKPAHPKIMPPSPPMSTDASFDSYSPTSKSVSQFSSGSAPTGYYPETTPPLEMEQRPQASTAGMPRPAATTPYSQQPYAPGYTNQPPMGGYYSPAPPQHQMPSLQYQRPLPQSFPPPLSMPIGMPPAPGPHPWQHHHHYMNPSHGGPFPQSQDRYICQTCNKAFSRPSSLRIHSHSHTGEKPFKCPHAGCGKAFSVRSNMKRHERGCHSFEVGSGASALTA